MEIKMEKMKKGLRRWTMNETETTHEEELVRLRRIEGQIRGVQRMIKEKRYCIDILTQIASVMGALKSVEEDILGRHLEGCVYHSFRKGSQEEKRKKIEEILEVLRKFRWY